MTCKLKTCHFNRFLTYWVLLQVHRFRHPLQDQSPSLYIPQMPCHCPVKVCEKWNPEQKRYQGLTRLYYLLNLYLHLEIYYQAVTVMKLFSYTETVSNIT